MMNATKFAGLVLCVLFFAFASQAQAKEILGGVVFSTGSDLVYYDFATKERKSMTDDSGGIAARGPFAVSENGKRIIFSGANGRIYIKKLPAGGTLPLKWAGRGSNGKKFTEGNNFIVNGARNFNLSPKDGGNLVNGTTTTNGARNFSLSPNGERFSIETETTGTSFIKLPSGLECRPEVDTCNIVIVVGIEGENSIWLPTRISIFGNLAIFPGVPYARSDTPAFLRTSAPHYGNCAMTLSVPDALQRFSIKRNAFFGEFSKNGQMFAVIYQTQNGWGPIEIRDVATTYTTYVGKDNYNTKVTGVYEIPVRLENCQGLAWKPDGSLTFLTEGKLFSLDGEQIAQGIQNSGWAHNPDPSCHYPVPVNNILQVNPVLVTEGAMGTRIHWVDKNSFLIRGTDNGIYYWNLGVVQKIAPSSPEEYSYVNLAISDAPPAASATTKVAQRATKNK